MPNFEEFDPQTGRATSEPVISIQRSGGININKAAYEALGGPERVILLFDRGERIVGMRRTEPSDPRGYAVRPQTRSSSYMVSGKTFLRFYGVDTTSTLRLPATMYGEVLGAKLDGVRTE
jgi:hypothetical protein